MHALVPRRRDAIALMGPESQPAPRVRVAPILLKGSGPRIDWEMIVILSVPTFAKNLKQRYNIQFLLRDVNVQLEKFVAS